MLLMVLHVITAGNWWGTSMCDVDSFVCMAAAAGTILVPSQLLGISSKVSVRPPHVYVVS